MFSSIISSFFGFFKFLAFALAEALGCVAFPALLGKVFGAEGFPVVTCAVCILLIGPYLTYLFYKPEKKPGGSLSRRAAEISKSGVSKAAFKISSDIKTAKRCAKYDKAQMQARKTHPAGKKDFPLLPAPKKH